MPLVGAQKLTYYNENNPLKVVYPIFSKELEENKPMPKKRLNYFTGGMLLPNRHESTSDYKYGFQGQEVDNEIKGEGNSVNYKYRMHDPRIMRFFAVDPLAASYPYYTPYSFSANQVIHSVELEGLETQEDLNYFQELWNSPEYSTKNQNTQSLPTSQPLGKRFVDYFYSTDANQIGDDSRNPTSYWDYNANQGARNGVEFVQFGQWEFNSNTSSTQNTVNNGAVGGGMGPLTQVSNVGNAFLRGTTTPTGALTAAVTAARTAIAAPPPPPTIAVGPSVPVGGPTTTPAVFSNNGQTQVSSTTVVSQQATQLTTNINVVTISFNTTKPSASYIQRGGTQTAAQILQSRFNALNAASGGGLVYNPSGNGYGRTVTSMGGNVNQAVVSTGVQSTITQSTTTTQTTTATRGDFDFLRNVEDR